MASINQWLFVVLIFCASQALSHPLNKHKALSMRDQHEQWMAKYGRTYKDLVDKEKHFNIFKENVEYIENFNLNSSSNPKILYTLGINQFADLTKEEFIATYSGSIENSPSESIFDGFATTNFKYGNITNIPSSIDWRQRGAVTPVKNQMECGACWAFATVGAIEGLNKINTGNLVSLSEQELVDCDSSNKGCRGGNIAKAFAFINHQGLIPDQVYPFTGVEGHCQRKQGNRVSIDGFEYVAFYNEEALQEAVSKQPVTARMNINGPHMYRGGIYNGECDNTLDHAVVVVGYGTEHGNDYWLLKNSWGSHWGENGFMRLHRGSNLCGIASVAAYPLHN